MIEKRSMPRVVNVLVFFQNDRFVMKTTTKIEKRNDRFKKRSFFKKVRFLKTVVFKTIVFKNDRFQKRSF